jgi:cytochrome c oxidase cbb3-type subunit 2
MPAYPWLNTAMVNPADMAPKMKALRVVGVPYSDDEIGKAVEDVTGKSEMDALIAYLQVMGTAAANAAAAK